MCRDCGELGQWLAIDGTPDRLCWSCLGVTMQVAWMHELAQRVHEAAHGYRDECPVCAMELAL